MFNLRTRVVAVCRRCRRGGSRKRLFVRASREALDAPNVAEGLVESAGVGFARGRAPARREPWPMTSGGARFAIRSDRGNVSRTASRLPFGDPGSSCADLQRAWPWASPQESMQSTRRRPSCQACSKRSTPTLGASPEQARRYLDRDRCEASHAGLRV